ncbi:site-specific integrase [Winogradskyella sp. PC D3.3]
MKNNKIYVLFILQRVRINKNNKCSIKCRITFSKKRKEFATGLSVSPEHWNIKQQTVVTIDELSAIKNIQLSLIKEKINRAFLFLQVNKEQFDVDDVYLNYLGKGSRENKTVLTLFQEHNDKVEKLIGKEYVLPTLWKFKQSRTLLKDYIKFQYGKNDFLFKDLDLKFIKQYGFYLITEKNLAQSSTYKAIQRFRKIIKVAIAEEFLDKDPFIFYKAKRPKTKVVFLNVDELKSLENMNFKQPRLQLVKNMFVFCCYTGLAFNEMDSLLKKHVIIGFDSNTWIQMNRIKTDKLISIPLLAKANEIQSKYSVLSDNQKVFPKISNQKFNSYLKEIAEITGIDKRLTHHIARKTFATTVLLYNDVPIEIVSELLGHSKISITQEHYAKIVQKKVSEHMVNLGKKLKKKDE